MAKGVLNIVIAGDSTRLNKELQKVERRMRRTGRSLQNLGSTMFQAIGVPTIAVGTAAVATSMKFEKMEMALTAIMGSSTKARNELTKLRKVAQLPGISLEQAIQGSVRLQAVGINADLARTAIEEFGNALAVSGGSAADMDGVILALTQMKGAGQILTQDLRQITSRIPMLASVMKKQFGTDVPAEINKMGISFEEFSAKMIQGMREEIPRASNTLENSFVNLRLAGEGLLDVIGRQLIEDLNIQAFIESLTKKVNDLATSFSNLNPIVKNVVYAIAGIGTIMGGGLWVGGKIAFAIVNVAEAMRKLGLISLLTGKNFKLMWSRFFLPLTAAVAALEGLEYLFNKLTPAQKAMTGPVNALMTGYGKLKDALSMASDAADESTDTVEDLNKAYKDINATTGITIGNFERITAEQKKAMAIAAKAAAHMKKTASMQAIQSGAERFAPPSSLGGGQTGLVPPSGLIGTGRTFNDIILDQENAALERQAEKLRELQNEFEIGRQVGEQFGATLAQLAMTGEVSMKKLARAAMVAAGQVIRAKLMEAVASYISDAFAKLGIFGGILAGASAGLVGGLFDAAISKIGGKAIPAMADGGIISGRTLIEAGEYSGARVNPEVIAPLDKLKSMMGNQSVNVTGQFRVRGSDLVLVLERENRQLESSRGYGLNG